MCSEWTPSGLDARSKQEDDSNENTRARFYGLMSKMERTGRSDYLFGKTEPELVVAAVLLQSEPPHERDAVLTDVVSTAAQVTRLRSRGFFSIHHC